MELKKIKAGEEYSAWHGKYSGGDAYRVRIVDPTAKYFNSGRIWSMHDDRIKTNRVVEHSLWYREQMARIHVQVLYKGKWYDYACLTRDIHRTWAEQEEINKQRAAERRLAEKAYKAAEAKREEERKIRQAEEAEKTKERNRIKAINDEEWEVRVLPGLIEAGVVDEEFHRYIGDRKVTIDFAGLYKLLGVLAKND